MPPTKKRTTDDILDDEDSFATISRLELENVKLNVEITTLKEEVNTLKAKLAAYEQDEESDDDDDDEESVCDGTSWSKKYHLLKDYKQQHGHCNVPQRDGSLGIWLRNQRVLYRKKNLPQDRSDKLEKIGIRWSKDHPPPKTWDDMFQELVKYKTTFGHCNVPINDEPALRNALAKWVVDQRKHGKRLRKQNPTEMTLERYERLNEISFIWKPRKK